jgi:hypothetical protein
MKDWKDPIDWVKTKEMVNRNVYGLLVLKNGSTIVDHYVTSRYEVWNIFTRRKVNK